ncbi:2-C-methyl-D-erythritol 4-phosphate cytidylyltransferase [Moraxella equi]|uniref:2-C-methyl-D-erythritol 4-phosphate cytidylyltransferase n=1 Tax=Moraxella equi TaxID=60442 RepID=A0A378QPG6_9GAMM|nr:2-C-methyl-D-erythritol 4-phosphate cytidylyltransferase [Moraxella equi]OPH36887.1 2-C-methyl-D-erythritol 4-phosphate cytidylyltransferase [Moraxella equi]STZ02776.1 2-C-methyl-D-erythritol 4-phosphate cytidylyltransferase [Moraxella equi]
MKQTSPNLPIHALIVSAGRGSRFGVDVPKQYLTVAGRTVLEHGVACLNVPAVTDLTLVVAKDDTLVPSLDFEFNRPIYLTEGGTERFLSVKAGVDDIARRAVGDVWVLIHDGARPCLPADDLTHLIGAVRELERLEQTDGKSSPVGAILATPVVDTLKLAHDTNSSALIGCQYINGQIHRTIDRRQLWQAQTPQVFRLYALQAMLDKVIADGLMITDEASGFEQFGQSVALVQGSRMNMKLTYPDDLSMIELMLRYGMGQA